MIDQTCPFCKRKNDLATSLGETDDGSIKPGDGDYMICIQCLNPAIVAGDHLRPLDDDEFADFEDAYPTIVRNLRKEFGNKQTGKFHGTVNSEK